MIALLVSALIGERRIAHPSLARGFLARGLHVASRGARFVSGG
jgi:hypothetical protein